MYTAVRVPAIQFCIHCMYRTPYLYRELQYSWPRGKQVYTSKNNFFLCYNRPTRTEISSGFQNWFQKAATGDARHHRPGSDSSAFASAWPRCASRTPPASCCSSRRRPPPPPWRSIGRASTGCTSPPGHALEPEGAARTRQRPRYDPRGPRALPLRLGPDRGAGVGTGELAVLGPADDKCGREARWHPPLRQGAVLDEWDREVAFVLEF